MLSGSASTAFLFQLTSIPSGSTRCIDSGCVRKGTFPVDNISSLSLREVVRRLLFILSSEVDCAAVSIMPTEALSRLVLTELLSRLPIASM